MITALLSLSLLVAAAPDATLATARVQVADLDLHSSAGRAELDKRLDRAVATVCPDAQTIADPRAVQQARACKAATREAVAEQRQTVLAAAGIPTNQMASSGY
jgi:UrcA family protein